MTEAEPGPERRLVPLLALLCGVMLLVDAAWAALARTFGWYHGPAIAILSLTMYVVAGFLAFDCGGRLMAALAGAVVCIVDNSIGTLVTWAILPAPVARTLPSVPDLAPLFAESVLLALGMGFIGGVLASLLRRRRQRARVSA
ncbi:MAG TPA: hypothetical protein VFU45_06190 [Gemmatimonadales bacterium]|nr:hypothetical protein [Gemmatimonadales bacterium]